MKSVKYIKPFIAVLVLTILDQAAKYFAKTHLQFSSDRMLINRVLSLTYHRNEGAAFGIFQGGRWIFLIFAVVVITLICYYYTTLPDNTLYAFVKVCLALVLAGALGNSIDRFISGFVVDFIQLEFMRFPIFNIADMYVVCGTIALGILVIFFIKEDDLESGSAENGE